MIRDDIIAAARREVAAYLMSALGVVHRSCWINLAFEFDETMINITDVSDETVQHMLDRQCDEEDRIVRELCE